MAGRGPAPKQEGQRRRRNVPERGEWVDLEPLSEPVLPELDSGHEWHPRTRSLWEAWRADPASGMFGPAEVASAVELAWLMDEFASGGDPDRKVQRVTAAELRLRMDGLGLTAKGKRDLRWRSTGEVEATGAGSAGPAPARGHLRAV
jgi:hypothetical protein